MSKEKIGVTDSSFPSFEIKKSSVPSSGCARSNFETSFARFTPEPAAMSTYCVPTIYRAGLIIPNGVVPVRELEITIFAVSKELPVFNWILSFAAMLIFPPSLIVPPAPTIMLIPPLLIVPP